jgi:hypothetical protein
VIVALIVPRTGRRLVQRSSAFVFRMGHAEFVVDTGLAGHIRVRRE